MAYDNKSKENLKRLLGKIASKQISNRAVILNTQFNKFQSLQTFAKICGYSNKFFEEDEKGNKKFLTARIVTDDEGNPIPELDEEGNIIYLRTEDGEIELDDDGDPIPKPQVKIYYKPKKIEDLNVVQMALTNLKDKGLNSALAGLGELTQLSAFVADRIQDIGGGVNQDVFDLLSDGESLEPEF